MRVQQLPNNFLAPRWFVALICVSSIATCLGESTCDTEVCQRLGLRIASGIDKSVQPCDDFYSFACGSWIKRNQIPDDRTWWSPWSMARINLKQQIRKVLEESYDATRHRLPSMKRAMDLFKGCLDMRSREQVGTGPLKQILNKIGGWPMIEPGWTSDGYNWQSAYIYLRSRLGTNYLINMYVDIDSKNTSRRIIYLDRPSLGLGRSELTNPRENQETRTLISAYKNYIRSTAQLVNSGSSVNDRQTSSYTKDINDMIKFETRLALASSDLEDRRDHFGLYNKMTLRQLQQRFPGIRWSSLMKKIFKYARVNLSDKEDIVVQDGAYYRNLPLILASTEPRIIANYIAWRLVLAYSDYTTQKFIDTYFTYQKVAYGQRKPEKPWETCYSVVDAYFPYTVGRMYVDTFFNGQSKDTIETLVREVRSAFSSELDRYDWMDGYTRRRAKDKLNEMLASVAYQPFMRNDSALEETYRGMRHVDSRKFFSAVANLDRWQVITNLRKLKKRVNRSTVKLSGPATVNAFNYFDLNYIQIPAGILQPPFFTFGGPPAINFGAIGKTIGHEIIHAFDDEGKQYDKTGNLRNWWTESTEREYNKRSKCFIEEYDNFKEPTTGLFVNGFDTQGENLADNGGLRMAFKAYKRYIAANGKQIDQKLPGPLSNYTPDQLFFLSFASIWCENERKESMRNTIRYGSHSPSRFRVLGTVMNSREFSRAFNCPSDTPMNPKDKCLLW